LEGSPAAGVRAELRSRLSLSPPLDFSPFFSPGRGGGQGQQLCQSGTMHRVPPPL